MGVVVALPRLYFLTIRVYLVFAHFAAARRVGHLAPAGRLRPRERGPRHELRSRREGDARVISLSSQYEEIFIYLASNLFSPICVEPRPWTRLLVPRSKRQSFASSSKNGNRRVIKYVSFFLIPLDSFAMPRALAVDVSIVIRVSSCALALPTTASRFHPCQGSILSVSVGNFMMIVATENCHVVRWNMKTEAIEGMHSHSQRLTGNVCPC
jgi:hypothetical protein